MQERFVLEYFPKMLEYWYGLIAVAKKLVQIEKILLKRLIIMVIKLTNQSFEKRI